MNGIEPPAGAALMLPLWIDTDACHDDAVALLMASALPYFDLVGISATYGRVSLDYATRNAMALITAFQGGSIPVFPGNAKPAVDRLPPYLDGSGLDGTGLLSVPQGPKQGDHTAVPTLAETLRRAPPQQLCIVCLGPLTNIAQLATDYPELVPQIDVISISAGVDNFNLTADPHAADIVLNLADVIAPHVPPGSPVPQVLFSEPQPAATISQSLLEQIKHGQNLDKYTVFRQMMFELLSHYVDHISPLVCDPLAVLALLPQRLGVDPGVQFTKDGSMTLLDAASMWRLVLESIEELEAGEM